MEIVNANGDVRKWGSDTLLTSQQTVMRTLKNNLALSKAMAPHSSTLAWRNPWTEEPGRLSVSTDLFILDLKYKWNHVIQGS